MPGHPTGGMANTLIAITVAPAADSWRVPNTRCPTRSPEPRSNRCAGRRQYGDQLTPALHRLRRYPLPCLLVPETYAALVPHTLQLNPPQLLARDRASEFRNTWPSVRTSFGNTTCAEWWAVILTEEVALGLGMGFAAYLHSKGLHGAVAVGRDNRPSGVMLREALVRGLTHCGYDVD